ncbi:hypothetical protein [Halalkalibacillus halophilus]|uniref:hypothetical protein n=1 Tax=Halalkalibacillus halophilus TaxID=392827 RepID=UPI0004204D40|nr:hypothetical protein [Halalkalibacillus halophilus]
MDDKFKNDNNQDEIELPESYRTALLASSLTTIADLIGTISVIQSIEETKLSLQQDAEDQQNLDATIENMQSQINQLIDSNNQLVQQVAELTEWMEAVQRKIDQLNL